MTYVDGYVIPVKKRQVAAYKKMAQWGKRVMAEVKKSTMPRDMPFVPGRMAFGGFRTIVQG